MPAPRPAIEARAGARRPVVLALAVAGVLATPAGARPAWSAPAAYTNPVIDPPRASGQPLGPAGVADPFVLEFNGEYYLYCSSWPVRVFRSTDLVTWTDAGTVFQTPDRDDAWNGADRWAPEVVYRDGRFYLYYTAARRSDDWRVVERTRRLGVAVADSPLGPFVDSGKPLTPYWAIDGTVFLDPATGHEFLFSSYLYEPRLPGAGIVVDEMTAWDRVAGRPSHVLRGSEAWEDKDGDPNNGSLRYTNEGPVVFRRHGRYYALYSGGSWDRPTYALAYATSDAVIHGGLDGPGWTKIMPPILRGTPLVDAPGHNALALAPDNVDDVIIYHARPVPHFGAGDRLPFVDRLAWNHDRPFLAPPSRGLLPAPERPLFADRFDRADGGLGPTWRPAGGAWTIAGGQAHQGAARGEATATVAAPALDHYVLEANLRFSGASAASARAGVIAYQRDERDRVAIYLERDRRQLVVAGVLDGAPIAGPRRALGDGFRFDAYHQLLVTKNADGLAITLDGVDQLTLSLPGIAGPGRVGLATSDTAADFDGVALTSHYEDAFDREAAGWVDRGGRWTVERGARSQARGGAGRAVSLKGDPARDYAFSASVRWLEQGGAGSQIGVVAAATERGELVLAGIDHAIWPLARFRVRHVASGRVADELEAPLPRGFDRAGYHTIRVVKHGQGFTFDLDGVVIAATRLAVGDARPGLFTDGVRAAFDDARMTRVVVPRSLVLDGGFESEQWRDDGGAAAGNVWALDGAVRANDCCAHSGGRRLVFTPGRGRARQALGRLPAGRYRWDAWMLRTGRGRIEVAAIGAHAASPGRFEHGDGWTRINGDFTVARGGGEVAFAIRSEVGTGPHDLVALDDVYVLPASQAP